MNKRIIIDYLFSMFYFFRNHEKINTTVFSKDTNNGFYLHWETFSPITWKQGTLKFLINRVYMIRSNQSLLEKELKHLKNAFHKKKKKWLPFVDD